MLLLMHFRVLLVFHKRGHHHHRSRRLLVAVTVELTGVRRRSGRGRNGRTGFVAAAAAIAPATAAAAAAHVVPAVIVVVVDAAVVGTSATFGFLHQTTPFSPGILEPDLMKIQREKNENFNFKNSFELKKKMSKKGPLCIYLCY